MDSNVFIERLRRKIENVCVYLWVFETGSELRDGLTRWHGFDNTFSPHTALGGRTPPGGPIARKG
jgi:putative transposase